MSNPMGKFTDKLFPVIELKKFNKTETVAEFLARGGTVKQLATQPTHFTQSVKSTQSDSTLKAFEDLLNQ